LKQTTPVRLLVHADDLGMSPRVNDAIFQAMEAGRVTSASILANGPAVEDAVARSSAFPHASFGVHLNLTEFSPLTRSPALGFLTGADGAFAGRRDLLCRFATVHRPEVFRALVAEWVAQVDRIRQYGVPISHLDSHNHAHLVVQMVWVLKAVQARTGIRRIRPAMDLFDGRRYAADRVTRAKRRIQNAVLRCLPETRTPDHFTSLAAFVDPVAHGGVHPGESVEVMVHPGHPACSEENALLATPWEQTLPWPVRRICYRDL
jgi:predicted glycoside hydrolase/deacetylase ChbG (UPF0249 family)